MAAKSPTVPLKAPIWGQAAPAWEEIGGEKRAQLLLFWHAQLTTPAGDPDPYLDIQTVPLCNLLPQALSPEGETHCRSFSKMQLCLGLIQLARSGEALRNFPKLPGRM